MRVTLNSKANKLVALNNQTFFMSYTTMGEIKEISGLLYSRLENNHGIYCMAKPKTRVISSSTWQD